MNNKIKALMTKRELEIFQSGTAAGVKFHSPAKLKQYIKLTRKLRDKYRDLTQRQRANEKGVRNDRTMEKAKVFSSLLNRYEKQAASKMGES